VALGILSEKISWSRKVIQIVFYSAEIVLSNVGFTAR